MLFSLRVAIRGIGTARTGGEPPARPNCRLSVLLANRCQTHRLGAEVLHRQRLRFIDESELDSDGELAVTIAVLVEIHHEIGDVEIPPFGYMNFAFKTVLQGKGVFKGMKAFLTVSVENFVNSPNGFEVQGYVLDTTQ